MTKRLLVGRPLRSERMGATLLPKRLALPVFCSDPLSSNAYATDEMFCGRSVWVVGPAGVRGDGRPVARTARRRSGTEAEQRVRVAELLDGLDE